MRCITRFMGIAPITALAFTVCLSTFVVADPKKSEYTYLVGSTPHFVPVVIAEKKGYFREEGLNVNIKSFTSGGVAIQSFIAGQGDFVDSGDWPAIRSWITTNGKIVGLHPMDYINDLSVVVTRSDITTAQQLKGKRIAIWKGTTSEFFAGLYLRKNGIDPSEVSFVNVKPAEMVIALDKGDIDAFIVWEPFGWQSQEVSGSKVHTLSTGKGYFTEWNIVSVRKSFYDNDPDAVTGVINATLKANEFIRNNVDEAARIAAEHFKTPFGPSKKMIEAMHFDLSFTSQFKKDVESLNGFMNAQGKAAGQVDWDTMFDLRGLRAVNSDLVR